MDSAFPRLVSADDHVTPPPDLWTRRLASKYADRAPHVVRKKAKLAGKGSWELIFTDDGFEGDFWVYEDKLNPLLMTEVAAGYELDEMAQRPMTYDEIRKGCFDQQARLADMDAAGIEASICFPNFFVGFGGQTFLQAQDKELALACVQSYNDWILEEWCEGSAGRLLPMGVLPLWDVALCAAEVDRTAARGMRAFSFTEGPARLGLPSIPSREWDPFFARCEEASIVVEMHIGTAPTQHRPSPDAPLAVSATLLAANSAGALIDWLFSGIFERFPRLKACLAESQIGWIPYFLIRADQVWEHNRGWNEVWGVLPDAPSSYFAGHVFCTFFDDPFGLSNLDSIGVDNVLFEVDYPHSDTNWPNSQEVARQMTQGLSPGVARKVVADNARLLLGMPIA